MPTFGVPWDYRVPSRGAFLFNFFGWHMDKKTWPHALTAFLLSGAVTAAVLLIGFPGWWGAIVQEIGRGIASMAFGSLWASLGLVAVEEVILAESIPLTLLRLVLLAPAQIALGLLWQRYRWIGGLIALAEHLAWNQWLQAPLWFIPAGGIIAIYTILIFGGKHEAYFRRGSPGSPSVIDRGL